MGSLQTVGILEDPAVTSSMMRILSVVLLHILVVTLAVGDNGCDTTAIEDNEIVSMVTGTLQGFIPRRVSRSFTHYYYGDHIDWEEKLSYNITEHIDMERLKRGAGRFHDEFLGWVARGSIKPIEPFRHYQLFRAPENVNNLWVSEVALASAMSVFLGDQFNIFLNGGIIKDDGGEFYKYKEKEELDALRALSKAYEDAYGYINDTLKEKDNLKATALMFLEAGIAEKTAGWFYDQLALGPATLHKTFVTNVPKEKFIEYMSTMVKEVVMLLKSEKTEKIVTNVIKAVKSKLETIDIDKLTGHTYLTFLRSRSLVLDVDIEKVFEDLNEVHKLIMKGLWEIHTGQWPAMVKFISNFFRYTLNKEAFWFRLDKLYHDLVDQARSLYEDRQKSLDSKVTDDLLPFFRSFLDFLVDIREGKRTFIDDFTSEMEKTDFNELFESYFTSVTKVLSKHFLSCYTALYGKPDFDLFTEFAEENYIAKTIKDLVFADWPKDEIFPKSFDSFVKKFENLVWLLMSSSLGSCTNPIV